jgi:diguanylate cyclase (GGDEF)-like protein
VNPNRPKPEFAEGTASEALRRLESDPPRAPWFAAGAAVVAAAVVDHFTGPVLSAAFLYVPPVAGLGWLLGRKPGLIAAGASTLASLLADWPVPGPAGDSAGVYVTVVWNELATGSLLAAVGFLAGEIRAHRDRLLHLANTDVLTGLHNRSSLLVQLDNELARAERFGGETSLLCIALDGFKRVNDAEGTAAGDRLLKAVAAELSEQMRRTDLVARIGGDEFAVLLTNTGAAAAQSVSLKVGETLNAWAAAHGHAVGFSLGWASAALTGMNSEQLLARATATLDERKRATRAMAPLPPLGGTTAPA